MPRNRLGKLAQLCILLSAFACVSGETAACATPMCWMRGGETTTTAANMTLSRALPVEIEKESGGNAVQEILAVGGVPQKNSVSEEQRNALLLPVTSTTSKDALEEESLSVPTSNTNASPPSTTQRRERLKLRLANLGGRRKKKKNRRFQSRRMTKDAAASTTSGAARSSTSKKKSSRAKQAFLDRIAVIAERLRKEEAHLEVLEGLEDPTAVTPQSDLTRTGRHYTIVTTAALPWFTGTAVNPLLRAAYLHHFTMQQQNQTASTVSSNNTSGKLFRSTTKSNVTLVIPWLELESDQEQVYGGRVFSSPAEQEAWIRTWLAEQAGLPEAAAAIRIVWYPARYHAGLGSVFAMGDILQCIREAEDDEEDDGPPQKMDVCILEEPEHCNWYRAPGEGWTQAFEYVVGIVHTNYKEYASGQYHGLWTAPALALMSSAMVRAYCHKVIKLSDTLQTYAPEKEATSNVHGVRQDFLDVGTQQPWSSARYNESSGLFDNAAMTAETSVYFIGKLLWTKGLDLLLEMQDYHKACTGRYFPVDVFGNGPDSKDIKRAYLGRKQVTLQQQAATAESTDDETEAPVRKTRSGTKERLKRLKKSFKEVEIPKRLHEYRRKPLPATFPGRVDHATLSHYKIFVNPSVSEVLCTTTAEALAMGKFAIIPDHPSNTFFFKFPNCLIYRNKLEFVANLRWALTHDPEPLTPELAREFTWPAATERLVSAAAISYEEAAAREKLGKSKLDERIAWLHKEIGKGKTGDMLRMMLGAGPVSNQVKYQREQEQMRQQLDAGDDDDEDDDDEDGESESEDEQDGLTEKFRKSSFAEAIRATIDDLSSFMQ